MTEGIGRGKRKILKAANTKEQNIVLVVLVDAFGTSRHRPFHQYDIDGLALLSAYLLKVVIIRDFAIGRVHQGRYYFAHMFFVIKITIAVAPSRSMTLCTLGTTIGIMSSTRYFSNWFTEFLTSVPHAVTVAPFCCLQRRSIGLKKGTIKGEEEIHQEDE